MTRNGQYFNCFTWNWKAYRLICTLNFFKHANCPQTVLVSAIQIVSYEIYGMNKVPAVFLVMRRMKISGLILKSVWCVFLNPWLAVWRKTDFSHCSGKNRRYFVFRVKSDTSYNWIRRLILVFQMHTYYFHLNRLLKQKINYPTFFFALKMKVEPQRAMWYVYKTSRTILSVLSKFRSDGWNCLMNCFIIAVCLCIKAFR